jgi:hypothetical protein
MSQPLINSIAPVYIADFYTGISQNGNVYHIPVPGMWTFTNGKFTTVTPTPTSSQTYSSLIAPKFDLDTIHAIYLMPGFTLTLNGTARGRPIQVSAVGPTNLVKQNFIGFTGTVTLAPQAQAQQLQQSPSNQRVIIIIGLIVLVVVVVFFITRF